MYPYGAAAPPPQRPPVWAQASAGMGSYANYPVRTRGVGELTLSGNSLYGLLSLVGAAAGAYHGYKRNNSIGWAIGWFVMGSIAPVITLPVSIAQGFGKPKK